MTQNIEGQVDEAEWSLIRLHLKRDAVILVSDHLSLSEVGKKVATDDQLAVGEWIRQGLLTKPTQAQIDLWNLTPEMRFLSLIVQPYVLVQLTPGFSQ